MRSSKSRSRNKQNNNRSRSVGNIINRVFESSGPEGKVRGTPQQIIDKYTQLARDSQLSNDRVAAENFQQHAEHYTRMLGEAMREMETQRVQNEQYHQNQNQNHNPNQNQNRNGDFQRRDQRDVTEAQTDGDDGVDLNDATPQPGFPNPPAFLGVEDQPDIGPDAFGFDAQSAPTADLVETPEATPAEKAPQRRSPGPGRKSLRLILDGLASASGSREGRPRAARETPARSVRTPGPVADRPAESPRASGHRPVSSG